ncbi:MAG: hypothetical protein KatS3mg003_1905 [Candidatus Nitrosocaldaceae archaeon]|nr:MAG: hypothetical protein KatS3mg003_1905 [Candidatus Nitrosocaldaceae archaeon]
MQSKTEHKLNSIPKISKKEQFLKDPDIARWHNTLARSSKITASVKVKNLELFCRENGINAHDIIRLAKEDSKRLRDLVLDYIAYKEEQGRSMSYIENFIKALKSWLRYWDLELPKSIKISVIKKHSNERIPNEYEYTDIINRADIRARVMIALISKAGLRMQVLGNYDGTDGLRLKDMPDIQVINGKAICKQYPCMIKVRVELSKNRRPYITFLSKQGVKYLLAYLNDRIKNGEVLNEDSPIIAWDNKHRYGYPKHRKSRFLITNSISDEVRKAVKPYKFRPYVFRSYFDTQLLLAESKGRINRDFRQFFMGHSGDIEHVYTLHKGMLPEYIINEMRDAYNRCEEYLDLEVSNKDKEEEELKNKAHSIIEQLGKEELLNLLALTSRGNNLSK